MSVPVESVTPGKCFVTPGNQVRRVLSVDARKVTYEGRGRKMLKGKWPWQATVELGRFAADVAKEVPCHYDPDFGVTRGYERPA
jgi:hypothetical protein